MTTLDRRDSRPDYVLVGYAPLTDADAARSDGVWDAAYADAIERGESHPAAQAFAADAVTADAIDRHVMTAPLFPREDRRW